MTTAPAGLATASGLPGGSGYPVVYSTVYNPVSIVTLTSGVAFNSVGPSGSGAAASSGTTLSWTHTPSGVPSAVLAAVATGISASGTDLHGTCTYGGVTMTWLGWVHAGNANSGYLELFGLAGPPSGAQPVTYTASTTGTVSSLIGGSLDYTATGTTLPTAFGTPATAFGTGATGSVTYTGTSAQNRVAGVFASGGGAQAVTAGTLRWIRNLNASSSAGNSLGSDIQSASGVVTLSGSWTSAQWGAIAVELLVSGNVTAFAGLATGTGSADPAPGGSVLTSFTSAAGLAAPGLFTPGATGTLTSTLVVTVSPAAGLAAGTGTAVSAVSAIASAGLATGTVAAMGSGYPAVYGPVYSSLPVIAATAGLATATGVAQQASQAAPVTAGLATAAGIAEPVTAVISTGTIANASAAAGTGTAQPASQAAPAAPGLATGTGTAQQLTVTAPARLATAAGIAQPVAYYSAPAGLATGTGTAGLANGQGAQAATATGTAQPATVSTTASVTAHPGLATAQGTAVGTAPRRMMLLTIGPASVSAAIGPVSATAATGAAGLNPGITVTTQTSRSIIIGNTGSAGEGGP